MPKTVEKKLTTLFECATAGAVLDEFRMFTGRDLLDTLVTDFMLPETAGVLITGSVAEGLATPSSDLDVLVVVNEMTRQAPPGLVLNRGHFSTESVIYVAGVELNVELVPWVSVGPMLDALLTLAPLFYNSADVVSVPLLSEVECRFVHRLRTGWPIQGEATVVQWRDELLVDLLVPCMAVRYLVEAISAIEDMESYRRVRVGSAGYIARKAVECLMLAALALRGQTSQSTRFLLDWIDAADSDTGGSLRRGRELLSVALPIATSSEEVAFCEAVRDLARDIEAQLCTVSEVATAISYIRSRRCFHDEPQRTVEG